MSAWAEEVGRIPPSARNDYWVEKIGHLFAGCWVTLKDGFVWASGETDLDARGRHQKFCPEVKDPEVRFITAGTVQTPGGSEQQADDHGGLPQSAPAAEDEKPGESEPRKRLTAEDYIRGIRWIA